MFLFRSPLLAVGLLVLAQSCFCTPPDELPRRPAQCDADGRGCLPDERCVNGECLLLDKCESDDDCPSPHYTCTFPAQLCELRPGFDLQCVESADCGPDFFCALGRCRPVAEARTCARRSDCPVGQTCDRTHFFCIEEGPCTIADTFPELACGPGETCEVISGRCALPCQNECTVATEEADCGVARRCDASCRCVECLSNEDCGPGLLCNVRAGRCESENLCYSDDDCENPLRCDASTALCQVPAPPCETDLDCTIAEICNLATGDCELPTGPCNDDRFEDADTPATAEDLTLAAPGEALVLDELQLCPDDDDVYAIDLDGGDNLIATISETLPQARATVWLLDAAGETSLRFADAPPYGSGTISYVAQQSETVYLRVNALLGATPYALSLTVAGGALCAPDFFEGEAGNDELLTATAPENVPLGTSLAAEICPGDVDIYQVDLLADEALDAELTFDAFDRDLDLSIVDLDSGILLRTSAGVFSPEKVRFRTRVDRSVGVIVRPFGNDSGPYVLSLERVPPYECIADEAEPDDDVAGATAVSATEDFSRAGTLCIEDVDVFTVPLLDFERLVARASFSPAELDVSLEVWDLPGENLLARSPASSAAETVTYDAAGNETVQLRVLSQLNTQGDYTLSISRENQLACAPDVAEPNDTTATAAPLPDGSQSLTICGSDPDFFAIDGVSGKTLIVDAAFIHADGDIDLMVLGIDGSQTLAASDGTSDNEHLEVTFPVDGTYFLRVFSLSDGAKVRYELNATLSAGG